MPAVTDTSGIEQQKAESNTFCRYVIHIPAHDKDGRLLHHIVPSLRKRMTQAGLHGRMVAKDVEADWGDTSHLVHLITIDALDSSETDSQVKEIAKAAKEMGDLDGIYITKQPLDYWIV